MSVTLGNALARIQRELHVPKDMRNDFGGYMYRSAESILSAVKPMIDGEGAILLSDDIVEVGGRVYVKSTAILRIGSEEVSAHGWAREAPEKKGMDDSQVTGSASSYARKTALCGLLAIDDAKDADATNTHEAVDEKDIRHFRNKVARSFECFDKVDGLTEQASDFKDEAKEIGQLDWMHMAYLQHVHRINNAEREDKR